MKVYIFIILSLSCLSFSLAQNLKGSTDNSQIISLLQNSQFIQEGASDFQKLLISTIQLKLKTNGQFDSVIELLNELYDDLQYQQSEATSTHNNVNDAWNSQIQQLNFDINQLQADLIYNQDQLNTANSNIYQGEKTKKNIEDQLEILNNEQSDVQAARDADVTAYNQRQSEQQNIVEALGEILAELENVQASGNPSSFIQTNQDLIKKLKAIGRSNPISAFVTLTMSFDPEVMQQVLDKLNQIKVSFEQSLLDDQAAEVVAQANFDTLMSEFASVEAGLSGQLAETNDFLNQNYADKANYEIVVTSLQDNINSKQAVLDQTTQAQQAENVQFAADSAKRESEEDTVQQVITLLQNQNID